MSFNFDALADEAVRLYEDRTSPWGDVQAAVTAAHMQAVREGIACGNCGVAVQAQHVVCRLSRDRQRCGDCNHGMTAGVKP